MAPVPNQRHTCYALDLGLAFLCEGRREGLKVTFPETAVRKMS